MDEQANPLERDHCMSVVLPGGQEKNATVHGSKPMMDLLVTLCASYHLNPSEHTVELLSTNKNNIAFKPNSPIGSLEAEKIVLKAKGAEEKIRRPYIPEASVRLLINYRKSHKAVVRVSPRVPLQMLLPVVCDKCEFKEDTTVLLRDSQSGEALDLTKTLNDHGLREVYAKDTADTLPVDHQHHPKTRETAVAPCDVAPPPPPQDVPKREENRTEQKKNTGFLSLFRRRKKKPETEGAVSTPASPALSEQAGMNGRDVSSSTTPPADTPKKRRAPQPPMGASQSVPNDLSTGHLRGAQWSAGSTLRSTKRRAPPPPCANAHRELRADAEVKGTVDSLTSVEEVRESDESDSPNPSPSPSSSPRPSQPRSSSSHRPLAHLHEMADPYLPSLRGKDFSDARCALAKVLTSSVSRGALVKRLMSSATFPKFYNSPSFMSTTQRRSDEGVIPAEPEPSSESNPPAEPEWDDPAQRRGMTTFKVIPSKMSQDPEPGRDDPDPIIVEHKHGSEGSPELRKSQAESEEVLCALVGSETGASLPGPETPPQEIQTSDGPASLQPPRGVDDQVGPGSPLSAPPSDSSDGQIHPEDHRACSRESVSTDMDHCGSYADERASEEEVVRAAEEEEDNDSFPPPPSPVLFNEDVEEGREDVAASSLPPGPASVEQTNAFNEEHQNAPKPRDSINATPSRFAQAVAMAVQRSRLQNHGKGPGPQALGSPQSPLPSPPWSMYQYGA